MQQASYGTWQSPISATQLASNSVKYFDFVGDEDFIYSVAMRPDEAGRYVIVRYDLKGVASDVLPAPYSARTRVHEYGGRSFTVKDGIVYFVNFADQNLYKFKVGQAPQQITNAGVRFAELNLTAYGMLAVAERHTSNTKEPQNFLALVDINNGAITELETGYDFYAFPTLNAKQNKIAWICWKHPNMPWDDTELWVADFINGRIHNKQRIENATEHQAFHQPLWNFRDDLVFITDQSNWWNPYLWSAATNSITPILQQNSEFADGLWILGSTVFAQHENYLFFCYATEDGTKIAVVDQNIDFPNFYTLNLPYTTIEDIVSYKGNIYFIGASPTKPAELVRCTLDGKIDVLDRSSHLALSDTYISVPRHIEFPTASRQKIAHAYFYLPQNPDYKAPIDTKPPLIVIIHGGPTAATNNALSLEKQYWTTRGFAIADVNYGGSTGYGRKYRKALQRDAEDLPGYWGDIDIKDCEACVAYLVAENLVDAKKVVIRGRSAGGYTTLAALQFTNCFAAGTSHFGVTDILALAQDTHKFESRYMDQLVGALPQYIDVYRKRSPINNLDKISVPVLVLQGAEDKVVPPEQAETLVQGLRARNLRVDYKLYPGEQHGFRKTETIMDAWTRELEFYLSVFYPERV